MTTNRHVRSILWYSEDLRSLSVEKAATYHRVLEVNKTTIVDIIRLLTERPDQANGGGVDTSSTGRDLSIMVHWYRDVQRIRETAQRCKETEEEGVHDEDVEKWAKKVVKEEEMSNQYQGVFPERPLEGRCSIVAHLYSTQSLAAVSLV